MKLRNLRLLSIVAAGVSGVVLSTQAADLANLTLLPKRNDPVVAVPADAPPPVVTVAAIDPVAAEVEFSTAVFEIHRTGSVRPALRVHYSLGGTGINGVDYRRLNGQAVIPSGQSSALIVISPLKDQLPEGDEAVVLTLQAPIVLGSAMSGEKMPENATALYQIGRPAAATVKIVDNDGDASGMPVVGLVVEQAIAHEKGPQSGAFLVTRKGDLRTELKVSYALTEDSLPVPSVNGDDAADVEKVPAAKNGVDYRQLSGRLIIPAGAASARVLVVPIPDELKEGPEHVTLLLQAGDYTIGDARLGRIIIQDDPPAGNLPPKIAITAPLSGATAAGPTNVTVRVEASDPDGTVKKVEIYGDTKLLKTDETIPYSVVWNNVAIGDHKIIAVATDNRGLSSTSAPVAFKVTSEPVLNPALVSIIASDPRATEPGVSARLDVGTFTVQRTGNLDVALEVQYEVTGSATPGADYVKLPGVIRLPKGAKTAIISVTPLVDEVKEGDESVVVKVVPPACVKIYPPPPECYQVVSPLEAKVVIADFSPATPQTQVSVSVPSPEATEGGSSSGVSRIGRFVLTRTGSMDEPLTVKCQLGGTAQNGIDYAKIAEELVIPAKESSVGIDVSALVDNEVEGKESVVLKILNGADYLVGNPAAGEVIILDSNVSTSKEPKVTWIWPKAGVPYPAGLPVPLSVSVTDVDGYPVKAEFFIDGKKVGQDVLTFVQAPPPGSTHQFFSIWLDSMAGEHIVTAQATDDQGNLGKSEPLTLTVRALTTGDRGSLLTAVPGITADDEMAPFLSAEKGADGWNVYFAGTDGCDYAIEVQSGSQSWFMVGTSTASDGRVAVHYADRSSEQLTFRARRVLLGNAQE